MFQRCAYYVSHSAGALRMELTELEPHGPYRLIVDDAATRHIEYFAKSNEALDRWAQFDAVMRPQLPWGPVLGEPAVSVTAH